MRKADTHFYFAGGFFGKYMNYGKEATEKKIDLIYSRKKKYTTRVFLTFFKTFLILCLFAVLVTSSIGIGIFMGIIDSAPELNVDSIVPVGYATTVYDSAGNLTDTRTDRLEPRGSYLRRAPAGSDQRVCRNRGFPILATQRHRSALDLPCGSRCPDGSEPRWRKYTDPAVDQEQRL